MVSAKCYNGSQMSNRCPLLGYLFKFYTTISYFVIVIELYLFRFVVILLFLCGSFCTFHLFLLFSLLYAQVLVYFVYSESDDDERRHYPRHKVARRYDGAYRDGQSGHYGPQYPEHSEPRQYLEHSEPRHSHRPSKLYTLRSVQLFLGRNK